MYRFTCSEIKTSVLLLLFFPLLIVAYPQKSVPPAKKSTRLVKEGVASYYAEKFHGRKMANGKKYDQYKLTAASNVFSLGTMVKVRNLRNKRTVIVEITDRMHPKNTRLIDLSKAAATELDFLRRGLVKVSVEVIN